MLMESPYSDSLIIPGSETMNLCTCTFKHLKQHRMIDFWLPYMPRILIVLLFCIFFVYVCPVTNMASKRIPWFQLKYGIGHCIDRMRTVLASGIAALHARIMRVSPLYCAQFTRKLRARYAIVDGSQKNIFVYCLCAN